jgi:type VI secretion system protein ImpG
VSPFNGKTTRRRPVPEVITELRNVQRWIRSELVERLRDEPMWNAFVTALRIRVGIEDGSIVAFVDDLHNSNRTYCRELWAALKPLKIKWGCQSTMFLADDEEMVKLAAESGCVSVFVGMESLDEDALDETNKPFNRVLKFSKEIKMFHDYGIMVNPGIVFGFDSDDALFTRDHRVFEGFDLLREYFAFPRKFLGCRLTGIDEFLSRVTSRTVDIIFAFDELNARLAAAVRPEAFAIYAAPAINLFEKTTDRIQLKSSQHEYHLVPDRSHYLDYEPHRVLEIYAHYPGGREKVPVRPLYSASLRDTPVASDICFSIRRLPRRRTVEEKRTGMSSDYTGTDMFISLSEFGGIDDQDTIAELSVRALCSNRHLTEHLPIGVGGADFRLIDDYTLELVCVAGPTPPREPIIRQLRSRSETAHTGTVTWRLVNLLSTNHLGLVERGAGHNAEAVRETLSIFAEMADSATERRIRGVRHVDSRPIVRRIRQRSGVGVARGIEITVTIDEKAFEGTGAFLIGAVLDRFFAEYSGFNHFTQTVIRSVDRGEIMRWPPRMGMRRPL